MAVLYECNQPLSIEEVDIPDLKAGQVLVRVIFSGICGSQMAEVEGKWGPDKYLPHCLGHEGSGIVQEVGAGVTKVKSGDHVILSWIQGAGLSSPQLCYQKGIQRINAGFANTFTEYSIVSENRLVSIDKKMPLDKAAILGCAVATAFGAVFNEANVKPGDTIMVLGTGGIGLNVLQAASLVNAAKIIAVGRNDLKLNKAKLFGATHVLNLTNTNIQKEIRKLTGKKGVDIAFETIGSAPTMELAYECIRVDCGKVVFIGLPHHQEKISIDVQDLFKGKKIIVTSGGNTNPDRDFPKYVELYLAGKIKLDELITHRFKLWEIDDAFKLLRNGGEVCRAILEL